MSVQSALTIHPVVVEMDQSVGPASIAIPRATTLAWRGTSSVYLTSCKSEEHNLGRTAETTYSTSAINGLAHFTSHTCTTWPGKMRRCGTHTVQDRVDCRPAKDSFSASSAHPLGVFKTRAVLRRSALVGFLTYYSIWVRLNTTTVWAQL